MISTSYADLCFFSALFKARYAKNFSFDFIVNKSLSCNSNHSFAISFSFPPSCHCRINKFILLSCLRCCLHDGEIYVKNFGLSELNALAEIRYASLSIATRANLIARLMCQEREKKCSKQASLASQPVSPSRHGRQQSYQIKKQFYHKLNFHS